MERVEHSSLRRERIQYGHERTKHLSAVFHTKVNPTQMFLDGTAFWNCQPSHLSLRIMIVPGHNFN